MKGPLFAYPERRVLEDAAFNRGLVPTRMFALLWPVWVVTISADVVEDEDYQLIDRYLSRGIAEGGWSTTSELANAFALETELVDRALRALVGIGHLRSTDAHWELTDLGARSVRDQRKYVLTREDRRKLYFEAFASRPLPRACYDDTVTLLSHGEMPRRFHVLVSTRGFDPQALAALATHPGRDRFNLPERIDRPTQLGASEQLFLPLYLLRCRQADGTIGHLAYSQASAEADPDLSDLVNRTADVVGMLDAEDPPGAADVDRARDWLRGRGLDRYRPAWQRDGMLRVTLPSGSFGGTGIPLDQLGSFEISGRSFWQLWCVDADVRWQALLTRMDNMLAARSRLDRAFVGSQVARIARQLELSAVGITEVYRMAARTGRTGLAAQLATIA